MRRRPDEHNGEQQQRHHIQPTGYRGPADQWREGAGRATDDDVLRRAALQPHGVDENVKTDRSGQRDSGEHIGRQPHHQHGADRQRNSEAKRFPWGDPPAGDRPVGRAAHHRVDIAVVPHVDRTRRARGNRNAEHRGKRQHRVQMPRRHQHAHPAGEHHEGHHPRLQQRQPVGGRRHADQQRLGSQRRLGGHCALPPLMQRGCGVAHAVSGSAAVPRRYGKRAASPKSIPTWSRLRPSNCPPASAWT